MEKKRKRVFYDLRTKTLEDSIVARSTEGGRTFVEAQPGDGTRYVLFFTELDGLAGAGRSIGVSSGCVMVTLATDFRDPKTMYVYKDGEIHWRTLLEDKILRSKASAVTLAEIIGYVVGCKYVSRESFLLANGAEAPPMEAAPN